MVRETMRYEPRHRQSSVSVGIVALACDDAGYGDWLLASVVCISSSSSFPDCETCCLQARMRTGGTWQTWAYDGPRAQDGYI